VRAWSRRSRFPPCTSVVYHNKCESIYLSGRLFVHVSIDLFVCLSTCLPCRFQITDSTLGHLASGCPNLRALSFSHCELITDQGIRQLAQGVGLHERLRVLELDNCPLLTDAALTHLQNCRSLERVELYDCQLITRSGIRRLKVDASAELALGVFGSTGSSSPAALFLLRIAATHTQHHDSRLLRPGDASGAAVAARSSFLSLLRPVIVA
jgi:Leucine Rich repeat